MDSDFLLICRMKNGDDAAIEVFVRKYYPVLLQYCHFHIRNQADAEDAVQEVFARFFCTLSTYQHYGKAQNYLYVIAANLCRDSYRKPEELRVEELPEPMVEEIDPVNLRLDIREALEKLPPELREVTILFFFQEVKQREIAKILGISLPLVKYRIKQAKKLLAVYLGKEEMP